MSMNQVITLALKSKRKPNFTEVENLFLIEEFESNKEILRSKINSTEMNRQKLDVWQGICNELNRRNPLVKRSVDEVRRKWKNMVTTARKDAANFNPAKPPSEVSQRIIRGYSEPLHESEHDKTNHNITLSPTESDSGASGSASREFININEEIGIQTVCKTEENNTESFSLENTLEDVCPRVDEVRAAVGCGMEVVEPGPPAAALTQQTRQNMRIIAPNVPAKLKRNNIQTILYNAKKRRLQGQSLASSPSLDIQQLQKEKLVLEKEKIVLEKEKLMLEKEKLILEIQCLRTQLNGDDTDY